jgi:hypothetical protein
VHQVTGHGHYRQEKIFASLNAKRGDAMPIIDDDEILSGVPAIAKFVKQGERTVYGKLKSGVLPGQRVGGIWMTTKRAILARIEGSAEGRQGARR